MTDQAPGMGFGLSFAKKIILLFEGDAALARRLEKEISRIGYEAKSLSQARKGQYPSIAHSARVLVWDSDTPTAGEDLRSILAQEKNLPVIVITGSHKRDTRIEELRHGTSEYLFKPFSEEKFREALTRALTKAEFAEKCGYLPQEPTSAAEVLPPSTQESPATPTLPSTHDKENHATDTRASRDEKPAPVKSGVATRSEVLNMIHTVIAKVLQPRVARAIVVVAVLALFVLSRTDSSVGTALREYGQSFYR